MGSEKSLAQGWGADPPPRSRYLVQVWLRRGDRSSSLSSLFGPSLGTSKGVELLWPRLTSAPGSERITPPRSQFPWHATSQDAEQISPDKNVSGYGTSTTFTPSPDSQDFVVLCQLVPGKRAFYVVRVPRLAVPSPASFRPHLTVTPLPWTR